MDDRVRVENQNIVAGCLADADIITSGEAKVFTVLDETNGRKPRTNPLNRAIRRAIIGNNDFNDVFVPPSKIDARQFSITFQSF